MTFTFDSLTLDVCIGCDSTYNSAKSNNPRRSYCDLKVEMAVRHLGFRGPEVDFHNFTAFGSETNSEPAYEISTQLGNALLSY